MSALSRIDWSRIERIFLEGIPTLVAAHEKAHPLALCLRSDSNGGFNFDVYQLLFDDSDQNLQGISKADRQLRLGDRVDGWGDEWIDLNELMEEVGEELADEDDFDSLDQKIRETLRSVAEGLANRNFGLAPRDEIWWMIADEFYQDGEAAWRSIGLQSTKGEQVVVPNRGNGCS